MHIVFDLLSDVESTQKKGKPSGFLKFQFLGLTWIHFKVLLRCMGTCHNILTFHLSLSEDLRENQSINRRKCLAQLFLITVRRHIYVMRVSRQFVLCTEQHC